MVPAPVPPPTSPPTNRAPTTAAEGPAQQATTSTATTTNQGYLACLAALAAGGAVPNPLCTPPAPPAAAQPPPVVAAARPDPATLAVQFWQTIPLPVPRPAIPPGYAITGKVAYLVTNATTHPAAYEENTPIGPLTIQAVGRYLVDWGDGAHPGWSGPYPFEGQPYPTGGITHTYDYVGTYTVGVREEWTAVWSLAGASGDLGGLATMATIPDFRAEQLQAVINN